jgi:hypothetical protein
MLSAIGNSLGELEDSDDKGDGADGNDDEHCSTLGMRSKDDKHHCVMATISQMAQQHMERLQQKQLRHD